jgi:tRNA(Ile2) C34 agmatinyltransferase TiaS
MVKHPITTAKCPMCGHLTATTSQSGFYCYDCKMEFDDRDDGDVGYQRPETIASRREEYQRRRRK